MASPVNNTTPDPIAVAGTSATILNQDNGVRRQSTPTEQVNTCCSDCASDEQESIVEEQDACCAGCTSQTETETKAITVPDKCGQGCCSGASDTDNKMTQNASQGQRDNCCINEQADSEDGCEDECDDDCCGKSNDEEENIAANKVLKDDSLCPCCLKILINEPHPSVSSLSDQNTTLARSPTLNSTSALIPSTSPYQGLTGTLRTCCKIFEKYCVRRSCCFVSQGTTTVHTLPSSKAPAKEKQEQSEKPVSTTLPHPDKEVRRKEKLELEVRGMDCIDCIPKVERALTKLTSVSSVNINYYSGIAELSYDPETITPAVIGQYVARATGFSVKPLDLSSAGNREAFITLPLYFENPPSSDVFKDFEFHIGRDPHVVELQIPIHGDFSRHPRDVLTQFKPYGARIFSSVSMNTRDGATRDLIVVAIRTIISATLTIPVLVLAWAKLPHRPVLYGAISLGLTTIIQGLAFPIISSAVRSIIYLRQADMNVLVSVSTLTAYVFSVISYSFETAGKPFSTPFFETSSLLVTLIFLGRTISAMTRRSTGSALNELLKLQKNEVLLAVDEEKEAEPLDSRLLYYNDVIRVLPNTHFATDGIVIKGESDVDESSITGESALVYKSSGSRVIAGTVNGVGTLDIQVTRLVHENSLSQIVSLVKQAQSSRPPIQNLIDKLSAIILPAAAISASIAFLVWALILRFAQHRSNTFASVEALTYAIAILAVSCPCAIGLVLPTVVSIAIRRGIREGILFRSTETLQNGHNIDVIAFDKTGTLTTSDLVIESANILVDGAERIIDVLVKDNKHPISEAIHRYLAPHIQSTTDQPTAEVTEITLLPGKGIKASLGGYPLLGGSPEFTGAINHPIFASMCSSGYSLFTVTLAGQTIAFFGLAATPRPNAKDLVSELKRRGKKVFILSGDNRAAVDRLSNTLGVPLEDTRAGCTPEDKSAAIRSFQAEAQRVCFVGDGTNDGPALSCAEVALSVAAGSEVALTAAGAILLGSDIRRGVLALLDIAQASRTRVRLALIWCVIYNIFAILLASGALVKVRIEPRWAGIGEVVSLVPVVLIAFSLEILWIWRSLKLPRVNST